MHNSFPAGGFIGNGIDGMWQAVEEFRSRFEKPAGTRAGRGDLRTAVLSLLAERPMHGYQIIREIEERSNGTWKPSAGSIYPTLQLLADEGLVSSEEANGRKVYSLTEVGQDEVASSETNGLWASSAKAPAGPNFAALPKAGVELAQAAAQIGRSGTPDQVEEAVAVLKEARRKLYSILAQD